METTSRESKIESLEQKAEMLKNFFEEVNAIVRERHSEGNPYHNERHPENVDAASKEIEDDAESSGIKISPEEKLARKVGAKIHDIAVLYGINPANGDRNRLRGWGDTNPNKGGYYKPVKGNLVEIMSAKQISDAIEKGTPINLEGWTPVIGNEEASWLEGEKLMNKYDPQGAVFTPYIKSLVKKYVGVTYPNFVFPLPKFENEERAKMLIDSSLFPKDEEGKPVYTGLLVEQPFLDNNLEKATVEEIAVAFGDLMYGGEKSFEKFFEEGMGEGRESKQRIQDLLDEKGLENFTPDEKIGTAKVMFEYITSQPKF